jgi:hypothetical protein
MEAEALINSIAEANPWALFADGYESALIGKKKVGGVWVAEYDTDKCIQILQDRDGMEYLDAVDFFYFNVENAFYGKNTPVFFARGYEEEDG